MVIRMSKYTTEVRYICESKSGFTPEEIRDKTIDQIIDAARPRIFNFSYPIYESEHKPALEKKILMHYYTREIAAETVGLWQLWLNDTLNLIMPKYNKLYELESMTLANDLSNIDVTRTIEREDDFTRTDNLQEASDTTRTDNLQEATDHTRTDNLQEASDTTRTDNLQNVTRDKFSDTPQGTIANVENDTYLTEYRNITESNTGTQRDAGTVNHTGTQREAGTVNHTGTQRDAGTVNHTGTQRNAGTQDVTETERGYRGSKTYMELLAESQDRILNIDRMIVLELADCFMKLW